MIQILWGMNGNEAFGKYMQCNSMNFNETSGIVDTHFHYRKKLTSNKQKTKTGEKMERKYNRNNKMHDMIVPL